MPSVEVRFSASTLQDFDAILRNDFLIPIADWKPRSTILFSLILPLGFSAAYKLFAGSTTQRVIVTDSTQFGTTAAPGYQEISNRLSLLINAYLPF